MILLSLSLAIICIALFSVSYSFDKKTNGNKTQILSIQSQIKQLQMIAGEPQSEAVDKEIAGRVLAPYDEIVPFISFLESLFAIIDKESKITIKDEEKQIMINRYADYGVELRPGEKFDLFLKALDGLYTSKYLTKIMSFNINYLPAKDNSSNKVENISLVIRLYFE
jgi:hypothetical protein